MCSFPRAFPRLREMEEDVKIAKGVDKGGVTGYKGAGEREKTWLPKRESQKRN
jgi:hypothetical protein